jgi:hypothetical protein
MADPNKTIDQNLLPVQAYFAVDGTFQTFIGQGQPFTVPITGAQSGLIITNSTLDSSPIGANSPSTGVFTNISTTTGTITTSPVNSTDIANKYYVDSVAQGLGPKAACQVGTTVNISLTGLQTIDTYTTLAGDRVLVKNQSTSSQNGIYIASASAWTRSTDMDVWSEVPGAYTVLLNGGQSNTGWVSTASQTGTIGVTAMPWVQFSAASTYYAGTGLTLASNTFSITNTGVTANTYGSASQTVTFVINAQGQITSATSQNIAIAATQITSGTIDSARISGSYTGITGVGTITAGTWNGSTIGVPYGGTGATTLTGYVKGNGASSFTANSTIPNTDISGLGTMSTQNANSVAITGGSATLSTLITSGLTGYLYGNGSSAVSASTTIPTSALSGSFVSTFSAGTTGFTPSTGTTGAITLSGTLNVANGGTGVTVSSGVNSVVLRDSNANITANALDDGYTNVSASGTTITLVASSIRRYTITGSGGQIIKLPDATTLVNGAVFQFDNNQTTGAITVNNNSNTLIVSVPSGGFVLVNLLSNSISAGSWDRHDQAPSNVSWSTNTFDYAGSITSATWNGVAIAINRGGTNGTATPTAGAIAYGSGTAYAFTAAGTSGQVLTSAGAGTPTWSTPIAYATVTDDTTTNATRYPLFSSATSGNLTTEYTSSTRYQFNPSTGLLTATGFSGSGASLTALNASNVSSGTLGIAYGGTGLGTTPTNGQLLIGNGTNYTLATLTQGSNITITNTSGAITIASTAGGGSSTITDDTTTNATRYPLFADATSGTATTIYTSSTKYKYNPSSGELDSPEIVATNGILANSNTVASSYTIPTNSNALSIAPLTLNSSVSVTIPSTSTWRLI